MKFTQTLFGMGIMSTALAASSSSSGKPGDDVQTAHFVFHGEGTTYELAVKADGVKVETCEDLPITSIDINDYNADAQCVFFGSEGQELDLDLEIDVEDGTQKLVSVEAQPIQSVSCEGMCISSLGLCYDNNQYVGPCCNGYCAANHCRPWNGV